MLGIHGIEILDITVNHISKVGSVSLLSVVNGYFSCTHYAWTLE